MATADFPRDALPPEAPASQAAERLSTNLEKLAARRNAQCMKDSIVRALVPGVGIAALGTLAYRFYLIDGEPWMPVAVVAASLVVGYRNGRLQQRGSFAAAVEADQKLDWQDRLSSALAFTQPQAVQRVRVEKPSREWKSRLRAALFPRMQMQTSGATMPTSLVPSLVEDAATRSSQLDPKVLYPTRFDRTTQLLVGVSLLLTAFVLMPDNPYFLSAEQKQLTKTLQAEGVKLQAVAKEIRKDEKAPQAQETKMLAKRLEDLGRKMQRGRLSKRGALLGMGELKRDMEKAQQNDRRAASPDMQRMEEALKNTQFESPAARQMQRDLQSGEVEKAAQELEKLAQKLEKGELSEQEKQQAANDLEKLAQQLRQQGGAQNEAAADQLEKAAQQLRQGNQQNQQNGQQGQQGQQPGDDKKSQQKGQGQGQGQQNQPQQGQQGGKQQQSGGQQGQQSQSGSQQQQGQGQGNQGAADALRKMAGGLRQNGTQMGNSKSLRDMLNKIREAENQTGSNNSQQSGQKQSANCSGPG
jgi:hypothetical protein